MVRPADLEPIHDRLQEIPANLVIKCPACNAMHVTKDYIRDLRICSRCGHYGRLSATERIELLIDADSFAEWDKDLSPRDPLAFPNYLPKRSKAQLETGANDSLATGAALLEGRPIALAVSDFAWMGGSMGSVFGERLTRLFERALTERRPVITVTSTGGARMQEGLLSLMQMAKTSAAVARLRDAKIPFLSLLTDPSTGGVQASFASLGDVLIAEPGALIGFTGARIIEQNFRIKLPRDFQTAEFQMAHGQIDLIVPRAKLKEELSLLLGLLVG